MDCQAIIPLVPTDAPQLGHLVYEMILGHFMNHDKQVSMDTWTYRLMILIPILAGLATNDQGVAKIHI